MLRTRIPDEVAEKLVDLFVVPLHVARCRRIVLDRHQPWVSGTGNPACAPISQSQACASGMWRE